MTEYSPEQIEELLPQEPWKSRYWTTYCPSIHQDLGGGLMCVSGIPRCQYRDGECEGHENQNWATLDGPEYYNEPTSGQTFVYSRHAHFIAAAPTIVRQLLARIAELTEAQSQLQQGMLNLDAMKRSAETVCDELHTQLKAEKQFRRLAVAHCKERAEEWDKQFNDLRSQRKADPCRSNVKALAARQLASELESLEVK